MGRGHVFDPGSAPESASAGNLALHKPRRPPTECCPRRPFRFHGSRAAGSARGSSPNRQSPSIGSASPHIGWIITLDHPAHGESPLTQPLPRITTSSPRAANGHPSQQLLLDQVTPCCGFGFPGPCAPSPSSSSTFAAGGSAGRHQRDRRTSQAQHTWPSWFHITCTSNSMACNFMPPDTPPAHQPVAFPPQERLDVPSTIAFHHHLHWHSTPRTCPSAKDAMPRAPDHFLDGEG